MDRRRIGLVIAVVFLFGLGVSLPGQAEARLEAPEDGPGPVQDRERPGMAARPASALPEALASAGLALAGILAALRPPA